MFKEKLPAQKQRSWTQNQNDWTKTPEELTCCVLPGWIKTRNRIASRVIFYMAAGSPDTQK